MKKFVFLATALTVAMVAVPSAQAAFCNAKTFSANVPTDADGVKCQAAISKAVAKFAKLAIKTSGKCVKAQDPTACPNAKDDAKIAKTALKSASLIEKKCDAAGLAGLNNSYAAAAATDVGTCATSQAFALSEIFIGMTHGTPGVFSSSDTRDKCQQTLAKESVKLQASLQKTISKCVDTAHKKGESSAGCEINTDSGTGLSIPTDAKVAKKVAKAAEKAGTKITDTCGTLDDFTRESIFACPGAITTADLVECAVCTSAESSFDILDITYNETGSIVTPTGGLQVAVDAASADDKLLLLSGDYEEEVTLPAGLCNGGDEDGNPCLDEIDPALRCPNGGTCESVVDGLSIVGCGAGSNDRPRLIPPGGSGSDGIFAIAIDGLTFQSLELAGWSSNGIFSSNADNIVYRDILGDGGDLTTGDSITIYSIFPVRSTNVLVEGSEVFLIRDAGIYVGQADGAIVRFNYMHDNVTGFECENSDSCDVYGNYATDNAGGLLSFLLDGPENQSHANHRFHHNVSSDNNTENFAIPGSTVAAVPRGTGIFVISDNDTVYDFNIVEDNTTFGIAIVDQILIEALNPGSFPSPSADQNVERLTVKNNRFRRNGTDGAPAAAGFAADILMLLGETDPAAFGTCFSNNGVGGSAVPSGTIMEYDPSVDGETAPVCP